MSPRIAQLWRFPIKAHGAEALAEVTLTEGQTMPWDRTWAVAHEAAQIDGGAWASCRNFSRGAGAPGLMALTSTLDETTEELTLNHPDLGQIAVHPERDAERLLNWTAALIPDNRAQSKRVIRVTEHGMTDSAYPTVSILSLSSLKAVGQKVGRDLSPLRFRGNIWFDGLGPWEEFEWVGHKVRIGDAELKIEERIERCRATHANPETGRRDVDTLGALEDGWGHTDFGVFGVVTKTGRVAVGDGFEVLG